MDWNRVIERNSEVLRRIVTMLVAMAGLPFVIDRKAKVTLPRHLRSSVIRLLRPAESAMRRLIIVAARGLEVTLRPPRPPKPPIVPHEAELRRLGIAVTLSPRQIAALAAEARRAAARAARRAAAAPSLSFRLTDPHLRLGPRRRYVPKHCVPRIGWGDRPPPPPPLTPNDPVDALRLALRLRALAAALDDLPGQAKRFARWRARCSRALKAGRFHRLSPMRPGPGYGLRRRYSRRPRHEVDDLLYNLHYFAFVALKPDTS